MMYIWLLSQKINNDWDTYDSCVVVSESAEDAARIHPRDAVNDGDATWVDPGLVTVKRIGVADPGMKRGVVCASFNAG